MLWIRGRIYEWLNEAPVDIALLEKYERVTLWELSAKVFVIGKIIATEYSVSLKAKSIILNE